MTLHKRVDGTHVYVTADEQRKIYNERKRYCRGALPPNYPVPALVRWGKLPPPDIVRLVSGGMWHHWNDLI